MMSQNHANGFILSTRDKAIPCISSINGCKTGYDPLQNMEVFDAISQMLARL